MTPVADTILTSGQVTGALVTGVLGIVAIVARAVLRNSRRSPDSRTALDSGWEKLTGGFERRLMALEAADEAKNKKIGEQANRIDHQANRITDLETRLAAQVEAFRKVQKLNDWLSRRVAQLVAFIVSHGMTPPDEEPRP